MKDYNIFIQLVYMCVIPSNAVWQLGDTGKNGNVTGIGWIVFAAVVMI